MAARKPRKPARRRRPNTDRRTPLLLAATFVCVAVGVVLLVVGAQALWSAIIRMDEFQVRPGEVVLESEWIRPEPFVAALHGADRENVLQRPVSIFERGLSQRVARAYEDCLWVRRVHAVRKVFPNSLEIDLELREPYAVIQRAGDAYGAYVVDADGVVLDKDLYKLSPERLETLGPFLLVHGARLPRKRLQWRDLTVQEGLRMLALYRQHLAEAFAPRRIEIRYMSQGNGLPYADATFVLADGTHIRWGRTPSAIPSPAEVSTKKKTARLLALLEQEGAALGGRKAYDLRAGLRVR
jgi:hypothetical protein